MPNFGEKLRRAREKKSITLEQIAEGTKIGVRYLRALEENDFDPLPGGVFDRGYVKAYAQAVGLDPEAAVEAFLEQRGEKPEEADRDGHTLDALRRAADRQSGGAAAKIPRLSISAAQRNGLIAVLVLVVVSVSAWGLVGLIRSGPPDQTTEREKTARPDPQEPRPVIVATPSDPLPLDGERTPAPTPELASDDRPRETETEPVAASRADRRPPPVAAPAREIAKTATAEPEQRTQPQPVPPTATATPPPTSAAEVGSEQQANARTDAVRIRARIVVDRPVSGSINCDNRRVEILDGMRAGTVLDLSCNRFVLLNVPDGGGVRVGLNGKTPTALVANGQPLDRYGIYP